MGISAADFQAMRTRTELAIRRRGRALVAPDTLKRELQPSAPKRVRQEVPIKLNGLESAWGQVLAQRVPGAVLWTQRIQLRVANGGYYRPDWFSPSYPDADGKEHPTVWETKGPKEMKGVARGIFKLKCAATAWPDIVFWLVWKDATGWQEQRILP